MAYADPPYPGNAKLYKNHPDYAGEVDHLQLVERLCDEYPNGWALSTGSNNLQYVLSLCPNDVRIAAWVKPFCAFKPGVNPAYAWEPIIWRGGRRRTDRAEPTVRDWVSVNITLKKGLTGAKPEPFALWLFELLGLRKNDRLDDLFPGTGAIKAAWDIYCFVD